MADKDSRAHLAGWPDVQAHQAIAPWNVPIIIQI